MKKISYFISLLVSLYFASYMAVAQDEIQQEDLCYPDGCEALLEQAEKYGPQLLRISLKVPDVKKFKTRFGMPREEFDEILKQREIAISEVRNRVLSRLKSYNSKSLNEIRSIPAFYLKVDAKAIHALIIDPEVDKLSIDSDSELSLFDGRSHEQYGV